MILKSYIPIFILDNISQETEKEIRGLKEVIYIHRTEDGIYIFPNPECNFWECEMEIREKLKLLNNENSIPNAT